MIEVSASLLFGCSTVSTPLPATDKSSVYSVKIPPPLFFFMNQQYYRMWLAVFIHVLDSERNVYVHGMSSSARSFFFHLHCLGKLRQYLNRKTTNAIAVSLVLSRLDYCNSCLKKNQLLRLQQVQHTAARTVTQTKRSDHITPILCELHWLPVDMRVNYKILSCVQLQEWHSPSVPSGTNTT